MAESVKWKTTDLSKRLLFGVSLKVSEENLSACATLYTTARDILLKTNIIKQEKTNGPYMITYFDENNIQTDENGEAQIKPKLVTEKWYRVAEKKDIWDNIIIPKMIMNLRWNALANWVLNKNEPHYLGYICNPRIQINLENSLIFNGKQKLEKLKQLKTRQNFQNVCKEIRDFAREASN